MLDSILSNPMVKNLAFGQIKKVFSEGNVEFIVLRLDDKGELVVDLYDRGEAVVHVIEKEVTNANA